jgi:CRISPR/Cas system-associated protein Csx1
MLKTYRIYNEKTKPVTIQIGENAVSPDFQQIGLFKDFSTRDKRIQDALENDKRFKSVYFLVYVEELEDNEKIEKERDRLLAFLDKLGIPRESIEGRSYTSMLLERAKEKG